MCEDYTTLLPHPPSHSAVQNATDSPTQDCSTYVPNKFVLSPLRPWLQSGLETVSSPCTWGLGPRGYGSPAVKPLEERREGMGAKREGRVWGGGEVKERSVYHQVKSKP